MASTKFKRINTEIQKNCVKNWLKSSKYEFT